MIERIAQQLQLRSRQVQNVINLLQEGATVPFIARYRKEATQSLDEVGILAIQEAWQTQQQIEQRQQTILKRIKELEKLTPTLEKTILSTFDLPKLEDIYLPYKQKRQTRAAKAKAKGLEPLAEAIFNQKEGRLFSLAQKYVKGDVTDEDDAIQGALDIIAEWVNEDGQARDIVRQQFQRFARMGATVVASKKDEASKYKDYFEFDKSLDRMYPHQVLAILRAEKEGFLRVAVEPDTDKTIERLQRKYVKPYGDDGAAELVEEAVEDAYKRLMKPSISNEFRGGAKAKADEYSINIFAQNLRQLLLASPLGQRRILAIDPGYATGGKVVCLSENGDLLEHTVIYPAPPHRKVRAAEDILQRLVHKYDIESIAVGNGTAGREIEQFVRGLRFGRTLDIFLVDESGASVYSASEIARKEFPKEDVTVRGAVSIGRRLMDPLAELVKIDPKSIGVGQYQHDVDQKKLQQKLDAVVESCVNTVGVDLNTASEYLLTYISGLGPGLAKNIVKYRKENKGFNSRKELLKVPRLGAKAFEQAAGFLRIRSAKNPLDNTAVHPETYGIVAQMAKDAKCTVQDLIDQPKLRQQVKLERYITEQVGLPTLKDIMAELEKPGRDPRAPKKAFSFDQTIKTIEDVRAGMTLPGIVTNVTAFGAFVDLGIKTNGLIHKSKLSYKRVEDPTQFIKLNEEVEVTVVGVDLDRKRIQLSMIE